MYYHVIVKLNDAPDKRVCLFSDLSENQLKKQFVRPYKRGIPILADGNVINTMAIRTTTIKRTVKTSEEERKTIQEESARKIEKFNRESRRAFILSFGHGYAPADIAEAGEDVSSRYIMGPPGGKSGGIVQAAINHPWISAIATAVIAAGIVKALGWV
jgi:hypothetical protein